MNQPIFAHPIEQACFNVCFFLQRFEPEKEKWLKKSSLYLRNGRRRRQLGAKNSGPALLSPLSNYTETAL